MHNILMCRSLTTAQKAVRVLQEERIYAAVTKAPQSANPGGCTYGVKLAERNLIPALDALKHSGILITKILESDGKTVREVRL